MTINPRDDLMHRLQAADPVDPATLPSIDDQASRNLLDAVMADTSNADIDSATGDAGTGQAHGTHEPEVLFAKLPEVKRVRQQGRRRHWAVLAGAAAAVMILVAGVATFLPDNTPRALAAVHSAAAATANSDSGQVAVTFWLDGTDGSYSEQIAGDVTATFSGADLALAVELSDQPTTVGDDLPSSVETKLVDGKIYLNDGSQWYVIEAPAGLATTLIEFVDPRSVLTTVEELLETEEIGPTTTDGLATTHYRSVIDLDGETLNQARWLPIDAADIDAEGDVTVDLFVDEDGLLRQLSLSGDVREPRGEGAGNGEARFEVVISFSNLGADLTIEAPTDAVPLDGATHGAGLGAGFGD
ncbi:MAG: hypothetical protein GY939_04905 [Actinomycetia bacterium]|nr:hypothetical protein [Actinomycetes bacterium]